MQILPLYREYTSLKLPPEDYTGTRTRRNYLRSLSPENIVSLNNSIVNTVLLRGNISQDQVRTLKEIEYVLRDDPLGGVVCEEGPSYMIEHSYGITIHGSYLGPRKDNGYRTVVKLKVKNVLNGVLN